MRMWISSVVVGLSLVSMANAQETIVSFEGLGRAVLYSANFERYFTKRLGMGTGIGILGFGSENSFIVPLYFSAKPIGDKHSMYVGGGATITRSNLSLFWGRRDYETSVLGSATLGYQYRTVGGMVIRPTVNFFFPRDGLVAWPGIMIGRSF